MEQFASTLLVAIIASFLTFLLTKKLQHDQNHRTETVQEQLQHTLWTLELWKEHESKNMITLRRAASDVVRNCFDENQNPLADHVHSRTSIYEYLRTSTDIREQERYNTIHELVHFYERVAIQFDLGLLNDELFLRTLARPFMYYFKNVILPFINDSKATGKEEHHWMKPIEKLYRDLNQYPVIRHNPEFQ